MKPLAFLVTAAFCLSACDRSKPPEPQKKKPEELSVADIPVPVNTSPPVETVPFEEGYKAGYTAGEIAARTPPKPKTRPTLPKDEELAVLALEAAGADAEHGPRWQRGWESGFRDGFERIASGKR